MSRLVDGADPPLPGHERALRVAELVDVASRQGPFRAPCLPRSLVLWGLLRKRGMDARLRIGVRRGPNGFDAHAWVEHDGAVLNDRPDVAERYKPFGRSIEPDAGRSP